MDIDRAQLTDRILRYCDEAGFQLAGVAALDPTAHATYYREWIAAGRHGSMEYMARPDAVDARLDPRSRWAELRTAVVVALNYCPDDDLPDTPPPAAGRGIIARYARGRDYHRVIKTKLLRLLERIEGDAGHALPAARAYVDTGPVLERDLARRAGIGWFGRNTMLVNPGRGSFFFLGTLLLELDLEPSIPFGKDHCGTCSACVSACPTGALLGRDANGAPVMDATRCISYLTIENRGEIPRELRPLMGNRVYGCDICQECCPYTRKFSQPTSEPAFASRGPGEVPFGVQLETAASRSHPGTRSPSLIALLETALDEAAWDAFSRGSAIRRSGRSGFARNVCVGLGNWGSPDAVPVLSRALSDAEPLVRAHAAWALGRVGSAEATSALSARAAIESDPVVIDELTAARSH